LALLGAWPPRLEEVEGVEGVGSDEVRDERRSATPSLPTASGAPEVFLERVRGISPVSAGRECAKVRSEVEKVRGRDGAEEEEDELSLAHYALQAHRGGKS